MLIKKRQKNKIKSSNDLLFDFIIKFQFINMSSGNNSGNLSLDKRLLANTSKTDENISSQASVWNHGLKHQDQTDHSYCSTTS